MNTANSETLDLAPAPNKATGSVRLHYIDWVRVLAVLLLFFFHVSRVYNADDPFYVKAAVLSAPLSYVLNFISVWHMPLLFVLAGASVFLAFGRRGAKDFRRERRLRLLIPFIFGFFVLIPPQTWIGARFNAGYVQSFWHYMVSGDFLRWNIKDGHDFYGGFGFGHLWFIIVLFVLTMVCVPLFVWGRGRGHAFVRRFAHALAPPAGLAIAAVLIMIGAILPDPTGLGLFYYLAFLLLGYVIMSDTRFTQAAERYRLAALAAGGSLSAWWVIQGQHLIDSVPKVSWQCAALGFARESAAWLMIVGLLGLGKRYLDRPSQALSYLGEASYPVYIIHQTVIVIGAYFVVRWAASEPLQWMTLLVGSVACTFGLYEIVRRFAPTRFLFGMRSLPAPAVGPGGSGKA